MIGEEGIKNLRTHSPPLTHSPPPTPPTPPTPPLPPPQVRCLDRDGDRGVVSAAPLAAGELLLAERCLDPPNVAPEKALGQRLHAAQPHMDRGPWVSHLVHYIYIYRDMWLLFCPIYIYIYMLRPPPHICLYLYESTSELSKTTLSTAFHSRLLF